MDFEVSLWAISICENPENGSPLIKRIVPSANAVVFLEHRYRKKLDDVVSGSDEIGILRMTSDAGGVHT
jgi:hypothetical protein